MISCRYSESASLSFAGVRRAVLASSRGVGGVDDTGVLSIPLGRLTGRHGSCSSVLPRRNALYDAPRVIIKHCSRTARQCATSQSSPEERRKLAQQSERQLNRALLAREPKTGLQRCFGSAQLHMLSALAESHEDQAGRSSLPWFGQHRCNEWGRATRKSFAMTWMEVPFPRLNDAGNSTPACLF